MLWVVQLQCFLVFFHVWTLDNMAALPWRVLRTQHRTLRCPALHFATVFLSFLHGCLACWFVSLFFKGTLSCCATTVVTWFACASTHAYLPTHNYFRSVCSFCFFMLSSAVQPEECLEWSYFCRPIFGPLSKPLPARASLTLSFTLLVCMFLCLVGPSMPRSRQLCEISLNTPRNVLCK